MVRPSGDGSLKPQQGAGPLSQSDASSDVARDQSVVRNARHNAAIAWIRLPISLVVSGFLFIFTTSAIGLAWLGALLVIELFAWGVRKRLVAGDLRFRMPHLAAICLVSLAWVALGLCSGAAVTKSRGSQVSWRCFRLHSTALLAATRAALS
jgi:hypothetical protein